MQAHQMLGEMDPHSGLVVSDLSDDELRVLPGKYLERIMRWR